MSLGFWQILLLVVIFILFFGRGKIPQLMGDIAEGIKSFKRGINDTQSETNNTQESHQEADKKS